MHLGGTVASNAATVTVLVKDSTGAVVHTETVNDVAAGPVDIAWTTPLDLPAGKYSVSFVAADAQGHSIPIDATARSLIKGVSFENGYAELLLEDGTRLALANVMQVNLPRS
jgi:flagellar hook assembly protein FlgD